MKTFDKTDLFQQEFKPLIDQLYDLAMKHQISLMILGCSSASDNEVMVQYGLHKTVCFHGEDTTPDILAAVHMLLDREDQQTIAEQLLLWDAIYGQLSVDLSQILVN